MKTRLLFLGAIFSLTIFSLKAQLTITSPNGGEVWAETSTQTISWTVTGGLGNGNMNIEYSTDSGKTWTFIVAKTPVSGNYSWIVPSTPSTKCLVRITQFSTQLDVSNAVFTITGTGTGIENNTTANLKMYPNPATTNLYLSSTTIIAQGSYVKLYNMLGETVAIIPVSTTVSNELMNISVADFTPGIYFVELYTTEKAVCKKVVISR